LVVDAFLAGLFQSGKVCAMYTRYGTHRTAPGRFHDLIDLVLITSSCQIDAAELSRSLT